MSTLREEIAAKQNKLAGKLATIERLDDSVSILNSYNQLWSQILGLPPRCSYIAVDLAVACNICISAIRVWLISGHSKFTDISHLYRVAIERVVCCNHPEHNPKECPNCNTAFVASCIQKLKIFTEITNALSGHMNDPLSLKHYLTMKNQGCDNPLDKIYFNAFMLYEKNEFLECLNYLYSCIHCCHNDVACLKLLLGNCYYQLGSYHSSVYHYAQCLGDATCNILAMRNSAIAYQAIGNIEAELEMRQLLVEAIKERDSNISRENVTCDRAKVYYHTRKGLLSNCADESNGNDLILTTYQLAKRSLECGKYAAAVDEFEAVVETEKQMLSSTLPPSSILYLMLYKALRLSTGDPFAGEYVLDRLHDAVKVSNCSRQDAEQKNRTRDDSSHHLLFCKILWLRADRLISKGCADKARDLLVSCLSCIDHVILPGHRQSEDGDDLHEFKDMILNNLLYVNFHIQQKRR